MPRQRWYAGKGRAPALRIAGHWDLATADDDVRARTYVVIDESSLPAVVYQVPIVSHPTVAVDPRADHLIGSPEPGTILVDGPYDPAYTDALYRLVTQGGHARGVHAGAAGHPDRPAPAAPPAARVLTGEQSNTSVIYDGAGDAAVICKIFRQLHPGGSPDIELQTALSAAGSAHVPAAIGHVEGEWMLPTGAATGSLAFAQEYLPGVEDAWRVALRAAAAHEDFADRARTLGDAIAQVHAALADLFPTAAADAAARAATADSWRRRLATAIAEVPSLAEHRDAVERAYARAMELPWPALQRIHGDLHLGQALLVPARGWVLLDFEGEPLRPMRERVRPDLALRDVAGVLRSFDYVAGSIRRDHPRTSADSVSDWAQRAREAFLTGYADASGADLDAEALLLRALELDKAVYETLYESRNRPTWVTIPLRAIARLTPA